jgi:hypothetical protein
VVSLTHHLIKKAFIHGSVSAHRPQSVGYYPVTNLLPVYDAFVYGMPEVNADQDA